MPRDGKRRFVNLCICVFTNKITALANKNQIPRYKYTKEHHVRICVSVCDLTA
jgi:ribosomal protein S30